MTELTGRLTTALGDRYRIERHLGEGGMALVYLAQDIKHERHVAVKVLRPELAAVLGGERFVQEIKTTALLQHPNILPLFDSGEADGFLYYVMPYVEGETLRERLNREKQLGIEEAVRIASEVAQALDYAHRHAVIHRDIKPENILLHDGRPMVADFGIALAVSAAAGGRMTETGLSLGTPHYMSPEQATAEKDITARSDVYSLGAVLYEMLSGEPPYTGATVPQIIAKILTDEPRSVTQLRKTVPPNVAAAVSKALEKVPADRFDSAADFARALEAPGFRYGTAAQPKVGATPRPEGRWKRIAVAASVVATALAVVLILRLVGDRASDGAVRRQRIMLGSPGAVRIPEAVNSRMALAPDGAGILFADTVGGSQQYTYWWKPADRTDAVRVPNMDGARAVGFSPDGAWVAYVTRGELRKQPLLGGTTLLLADSVNAPGAQSLAWLDDNTIMFENAGPIVERISEDGRTRDTVSVYAQTGYPIHLSRLAGSGALLSSCTDASCSGNRLYLVETERDTIHALADDVLRAWEVPGGFVVYVDRRGGVFAAELDRNGMRLEPPMPLFDGVATTDRTAEMEIGPDGSLIYLRGQSVASQHTVVWVDREGRAEPFDRGWGAADFVTLSLSPGDDRLALSIVSGGVQQVWVKELPDGPLTRLTVGAAAAERPVWTPDGRYLAYLTADSIGHSHARRVRSDGSSAAPELLLVNDRPVWEVLFPGPRGRLVFRAGATGSNADVGFVDLPNDTAVTWVLNSQFDENAISLAPDGRWLAYVSDFSGRNEVYVRPFPDATASRVQISTGGGSEPLWAKGGRELFFRDAEGWMTAASVETQPEFRVISRERLFFAGGYRAAINYRAYDVTSDDRRFVMLQQGEAAAPQAGELILVEHWFSELRRITGSR
jgi:serine/threonine-protein kinase